MAGEQILLDPTAEGTGTQLDITDTTAGYSLLEHDYPEAEDDAQWASSADTEGERRAGTRPKNHVVTCKIRCLQPAGGTPSIGTLVKKLQLKIGKLDREGGTYRRVLPSGDAITFDVEAAAIKVPSDKRWVARQAADVEMSFTCRPYGRGAEVDLGDNVETTLPALIFTDGGAGSPVNGDVPALGRLVVDNDATQDWWGVITALESDAAYDITASTAALLYQAETRTPLGGSATAVGPSGASGSGSNVVRNTALAQVDVALLSTQASGGGAHLTHIGTFRVFARVQVPTSNTGLVSLAMETGVGDFTTYTRNDSATIPASLGGTWALIDLGSVTIPPGSVRWEARIVARSTVVGDDIDIDILLIAPTSLHYGVAESVLRVSTPTSWTGRDEFGQAGGSALNALAAPVGGSWASTGSATDFTTGGVSLIRSVSTDTGINGRLGVLGTAMTTTAVSLDVNINAVSGCEAGLLLRYVDASNYATVFLDTNGQAINYRVVVAGATVAVAELAYSFDYASWHTLRAYADPLGNLLIWGHAQGATVAENAQASIAARLSQLATGGVLASGKTGIRDFCVSGSSVRAYDNFAAWAPGVDAGVFAGQSIEVRSDRVLRENAAGTFSQRPASFVGDYLTIPPNGLEQRSVRMLVKPLYLFEHAPGVRIDDRIDDLSARLFCTPRYLVIPEP